MPITKTDSLLIFQLETPGEDIPEEEEDPDKAPKEDKFKLKKCVVQVLLAKGEPMKVKRILKKVSVII